MIVQHVCSVVIFICCFAGIVQEQVSPVAVVSWGTLGTVLGWAFWDFWVTQEEAAKAKQIAAAEANETAEDGSTSSGSSVKEPHGLGLLLPNGIAMPQQGYSHSGSATSMISNASNTSTLATGHPTGAPTFATYSYHPPYGESMSRLSPRNQQRLATVKSAILIYCALLGLSPILKSLTKSTTSDSIWAMSCWLMCINVFFFDYSGGVDAAKYAET